MLDEKAQKAVEDILKRGNDVEIRSKKDGIQIIEVVKKTRYSTKVGENSTWRSGVRERQGA